MKFYIHETYLKGTHLWAYTAEKEGVVLRGSLDAESKNPMIWTYCTDVELNDDASRKLLAKIQKDGGAFINEPPAVYRRHKRTNEEIEESLMAQKADMERNILERVQAQAAKTGIKVTGITITDIAVGEPTEERNSIRRVIDLILRRT